MSHRFRGNSRLAGKISAARHDVHLLIAAAGGRDVHVFGPVVTGTERPRTDIDLLFDADRSLPIAEIVQLESRLAAAVGADVHLVQAGHLRPHDRTEVLAHAVPL